MKTTPISELKATLSEHLARVKAGEEVIITERGKPIARIVPLRQDKDGLSARLLELARAGLARVGSGKLPDKFWRMTRPKDPRGAGVSTLEDERMTGR